MLLILSASVLLAAPPQVQIRVERGADSTRTDSTAAADSARRHPRRIELTPHHLATAFDDEAARRLLMRAREARMLQDSTLLSYDATTTTRFSVGLGLSKWGRQRLAFRAENASRVRWHRESGVWIDVKGQRAVAPIVAGNVDMEKEFERELENESDDIGELALIPYYPGREPLLLAGGELIRADIDEEEMIHPIARGAEAYYRYASGDSIDIRLGDGRRIQVREIRVRPRRPYWNVVVGSLWFDAGSGQLVRAAFRMSEPMDVWTEATAREPDDMDDVPAWVKPLISPMRAEITAVTIEYGLHQGRYWLPRVQSAEGRAQIGFMRVPVEFTTSVRYASVNGLDSIPAFRPPRAPGDTITPRTAEEQFRDSVIAAIRDSLRTAQGGREASVTIGFGNSEVPDSVALERRARRLARAVFRERNQRSIRQCDTAQHEVRVTRRFDGTLPVAVTLPCDRSLLAVAPELPPSIYDPGEEVFDRRSREELMASLDLDAQAEWNPQKPVLKWGLGEGLLRYNRIEGLAPGVALEQRLGAGYLAKVSARAALADLSSSSGEISAERSNGRITMALGAYRRLGVANDFERPLTFGSSLNALLFGRDDGLYYHATGLELSGVGENHPRVEWRLFAERHAAADVATEFSFASLMTDAEFRPNIVADAGDFGGFEFRTAGTLGADPMGWRLLADARFESAANLENTTQAYTRLSGDLTASRAFGARFAGALTGASGVIIGQAPVQRTFYIGGPRTVRGIAPGAQTGTMFWLGRAEVGGAAAGFRPTTFFDVGWAGNRFEWDRPGATIAGAGVGISALDGMLRADLSRGIRPTRQWRFDFYVEGRF